MTTEMHPDDQFHTPSNDDPYWTETCWFTFAIPEINLSGQLYPFFRTNQQVYSGGAFFWDQQGHEPHTVRFGKNFWHLPMTELPPKKNTLTDIELANGIAIKCIEPMKVFEVKYLDPDCGEAEVDLTFTAICPPNYLQDSHFEQPGRYRGTVRLGTETINVDSYGMRDRSWSNRSQFGIDIHGTGAMGGGYDYGTADDHNAFHIITMAFSPDDCIAIHGYYMKDGEYAKLRSGKRTVLDRDPKTGAPIYVKLEGIDELGRELLAHGRCLNKLGVHLNPNLFTWNCLTLWEFDGHQGYGEDHDNWTAAGARRFFRNYLYQQ